MKTTNFFLPQFLKKNISKRISSEDKFSKFLYLVLVNHSSMVNDHDGSSKTNWPPKVGRVKGGKFATKKIVDYATSARSAHLLTGVYDTSQDSERAKFEPRELLR